MPGADPSSAIQRVVSLSPSITREILDLGYESIIVGVTSFDDYRGKGVGGYARTAVREDRIRWYLLSP